MDLVAPFNSTDIAKCGFYHYPYHFPAKDIVIVRPLYDSNPGDVIQADIVPLESYKNAFDHAPFEQLQLREDEAFLLVKAKNRRVIATSLRNDSGFINVSPVYSSIDWYKERYGYDNLKTNIVPGIIYLAPGEYNKESVIVLSESNTAYVQQLKPLRLKLNNKGTRLLDDYLMLIHDIYSNSTGPAC